MKSILYNFLKLSLIFLFVICHSSCEKFLDEKPRKDLIVPRSVADLQKILDGDPMTGQYPQSAIVGSDDFYLTGTTWASVPYIEERNSYIWDKDVTNDNDWYFAYQRIFNSNAVLDELPNIDDPIATDLDRNKAKGSALFFRAFNFYELAQIYVPQYSPATTSQNTGIPLRLKPDINDVSVRSTLQETYDRIILDAKESAVLLPASIDYKIRPSKAASFALLARTYLVMGDYENAGKYADSCLAITNSLIDYNDASKVDLTSTSPAFKIFNEEVIFHSESRTIYSLLDGTVDSVLFSTYANNDLRQKAFYMVGTDGKATFRGCYNGKDRYFPFNGLTTDEIYLIRAECFARAGNATQAMTMLNTLLVNRWATGTFSPYTASDPSDALKKIFDERRKELCFRPGLRWSDLRRLNLDNNYAITIKRNLDGQTFELAPNDLRYTFLIPLSVISISGMQQNIR